MAGAVFERGDLEVKSITMEALAGAVFERGDLEVKSITVEASKESGTSPPPPPKTLLVLAPTLEGTYPVMLFLHGFYLRTNFYSQLLQHVSSHGYIVVAPQLYLLIPPTGTEELNSAAEVTNWLPQNLQSILPNNIIPNLNKLALSGHSRGGKTAFALALGHSQTTLSLKFTLLIGIDPVAGITKSCQTQPKILTYIPKSFDLKIPVNVIGTGLGPEQKNCIFPPCAPDGVNHEEFFSECKPPCCYFVTKDYGHMDMLDDDLSGCVGSISGCICKNGKGDKDPMRRCVGGIVVAFLKAYLDDDEDKNGDLKAIVDIPDIAPVKLQPVCYIEA